MSALNSCSLCRPSRQRGRLWHSADEPGLRELCHAPALCPAGEQDPAALTAARCAYWRGRSSGGGEYAPTRSQELDQIALIFFLLLLPLHRV